VISAKAVRWAEAERKALEKGKRVMQWDTELERLVTKVGQVFGDHAVAEAYLRAISVTPALQHIPDDVAALEELLSADMQQHTKFVDGRASAAAFREELRRLLTVQ
jgi:hypothetical protein